MIVLVIVGGGMLGHKLVQKLGENFDVWTTLRGNFENYEKFKIFNYEKTFENTDILNFVAVEKIIARLKPQVVVNAAGIVKQLPISENVIEAIEINSIFPHRLQKLSLKYSFRLITIGTDCVFSGKKGNYKETDEADAADIYGKSKSLGETNGKNSLVLRTSIIGRELTLRRGLVEWFLSNGGKKVKGFRNAVFSGVTTAELAAVIRNLILNWKDLDGLYHLSSEPISKYDLLHLIKQAYRLDIEIEPNEDFKIDRSLDSTAFRLKVGYEPLSWEEMIREMADDAAPYDKLDKQF